MSDRNLFQIRCYHGDARLWSFVWIEGEPYGSMLQDANQWLEPRYPFKLMPWLVAHQFKDRGFRVAFTDLLDPG